MRSLADGQIFIDEYAKIEAGHRANEAAALFLRQSIKRALWREEPAQPPEGVKAIAAKPMPRWQARALLRLAEALPFYLFFKIKTRPGTILQAKKLTPIVWIGSYRRLAPDGWAYRETHVLHETANKIKANRVGEISTILRRYEKRARASYSDYIARQVSSSR